MRIAALPDMADVCCVAMPVLSLNSIRMSPGFMLAFSSSSSPEMNSMRVGIFSMVRVPRVVCTTISPSSSSSSHMVTVSVASDVRGNVSFSVLSS